MYCGLRNVSEVFPIFTTQLYQVFRAIFTLVIPSYILLIGNTSSCTLLEGSTYLIPYLLSISPLVSQCLGVACFQRVRHCSDTDQADPANNVMGRLGAEGRWSQIRTDVAGVYEGDSIIINGLVAGWVRRVEYVVA